MCCSVILTCCLLTGGVNAQQYNWETPPYAEDYAFITNDGGLVLVFRSTGNLYR